MARLKQTIGVKHRTSISVHLKASLKILSLNTVDLAKDIQTLLGENIFLEETRPAELSLDDVMLAGSMSSESASGDTFENYTSRGRTLQEHLAEQLSVSDLGGRPRELASLIISAIHEDGFLHDDLEVFALRNGFSRKELGSVLAFLLQLDPPGICARDVWQSLEWQAGLRYPKDTVLADIISVLQQGNAQLTEFDEGAIEGLREYLNIPARKATQAIEKLKTLNVNPAGNFRYTRQDYVIPEVVFTVRERTVNVGFSNPLLPEITVNEELFKSLQKDKNLKQWKDMFYDARNLVKSIDYRKNSIVRLAKIIASRQRMFFLKGEKYLKPMILKDLAEAAALNVSTVSRILRHKYCMTPHGIFPMSHFLMKRVKTLDEESLGVRDLKNSISFIIEQENKRSPLSDSEIMTRLGEYGFNIKRRTVAKYRKLLHIPSAKQRTVLD